MLFLKAVKYILIVQWFLAAAWANSEHHIRFDQNIPYMLVYQSSSDDTNREPGIYRRDEERNWVPILHGSILMKNEKGPVWHQLQMGEQSEIFDSMVVRDGDIEIFNLATRSERNASYIRIGGDQAPLIDPITGTTVRVPKVDLPEKINFYSKVADIEGRRVEVIIVSMRLFETLTGEGITFATVVSRGPNDSLEVVNQPFLLDYRFRDKIELQDLFLSESDGLRSENLMQSYSRPFDQDHPAMQAWRTELVTDLNRLLEIEPPVYYDFRGHVNVPTDIKSEVVESGSIKIREAYTFSGEAQVQVGVGNLRDLLSYTGKVDRNSEGQPKAYTNESQGLISVSNSTYLLLKTDSGNNIVGLELEDIELPDSDSINFSFHYVAVDNRLFIIESRSENGEEVTIAHKYKLGANDRYIKEAAFKVADSYYNEDEIAARTRDLTTDEGGWKISKPRLLFDISTPAEEDPAKVQPTENHGVHVDLIRSNENDLALAFPVAKNVERLGHDASDSDGEKPSAITYFTYDDEGAEELGYGKQSGLRLGNYGDLRSRFFRGSIVNDPIERKVIWHKASGNEREFSALLSLVAINKSYGSKKTISLKVVLTDERAEHFLSVDEVDNFDLPEGADAFARVIPTGRRGEGFAVVWGTSIGGKGQVFYKSFTVDAKKRKDSETSEPYFTAKIDEKSPKRRLEKGSKLNNAMDVMDRVRFLDDANPAYIVSPELDPKDENYYMVDLITGNNVGNKQLRTKQAIPYYDFMKGAADDDLPRKTAASVWHIYPNFLTASNTFEKLLKEENHSSMGFPDLDLMDRIEAAIETPQNLMIVTPDKYKVQVREMFLRLYANPRTTAKWSRHNDDLDLFIYGDTPEDNQDEHREILKNLVAESGKHKRPVLFADAENILEIGRIDQATSDEELVTVPPGICNDAAKDDEGNCYPHALKWLLTEGEDIDYEEIREKVNTTYSKIVVVSESELERFEEGDASLEASYGVLDQFEQVRLPTPDYETQKNWIRQIFDSPQISKLDYNFDASNIHRRGGQLDSDAAKDFVVEYLVNRVTALAKAQNHDLFEAVGEIRTNLENILLLDPKVRRRRVVDASVVLQVLAKSFDVNLDPALMPDGDRLKMLAREDFPDLVYKKTGYNNYELISDLRDLMIQQSSGEGSLAVGASFILAGEKGTGKTIAIESIFETLDLKYYDYMNGTEEDNKGSEVFFINGPKISDEAANGFIEVKKLLEHLDIFLAQPNGYRGIIVVDDVHQIPPKARGKILQRIRTIQSLKAGERYVVKAKVDGVDVVESFPPNNLVIGFTTNFTNDDELIKKHQKVKDKDPTTADLVVATWAQGGKEVTFDHSAVDRFGMIRSVGNPSWAKETRLIDTLVEQAGEDFFHGHYFAVAPTLIREFVGHFHENMSGREFGQKIPSSVGALFSESRLDDYGAYILVPRSDSRSAKPASSSAQDIYEFLEKTSVFLPLKDNFEAQLHYLASISSYLRIRILTYFVEAMARSSQFSGSAANKRQYLSWAHLAMFDHLNEKAEIPLKLLAKDPKGMGADTDFKKDEFLEIVEQLSPEGEFFPKIFEKAAIRNEVAEIFSDSPAQDESRSRGRVNQDFVSHAQEEIETYFYTALGVEDRAEMERGLNVNEWLEGMSERDPDEVRKDTVDVGDRLIELFNRYVEEVNHDDVLKYHKRNAQGDPGLLTFYDFMRTYLIILDRAITRLPWSKSTRFIVNKLEDVGNNVSNSGHPAAQKILFQDNASILKPISRTHLVMTLDQSKARQSLDASQVSAIRSSFPQRCVDMLLNGRTDEGVQ